MYFFCTVYTCASFLKWTQLLKLYFPEKKFLGAFLHSVTA